MKKGSRSKKPDFSGSYLESMAEEFYRNFVVPGEAMTETKKKYDPYSFNYRKDLSEMTNREIKAEIDELAYNLGRLQADNEKLFRESQLLHETLCSRDLGKQDLYAQLILREKDYYSEPSQSKQ